MAARARNGAHRAADDELVVALLAASRALVGIAARSLGAIEDAVTLQQYRVLVVLAERGEQRAAELALVLGIHPSSVTRLCDRLVAKGLIDRLGSPTSRREVDISLTEAGRKLVQSVMRARQQAIREVVRHMPDASRAGLIEPIREFALAAGDLPDDAWRLGWSE